MLPPGWEGVYFPFDVPLAGLRPDGSPIADSAGVDESLMRRYVGEDTTFHRPLRFGDEVTQVTRPGKVIEKQGRSGKLIFSDIERSYFADGELAIESVWHDVFLAGSSAPAISRPAPAAAWTEPLTLDNRQLFRFSALTFNTHRIHYDRDWARDAEGLDNLLVHGPLTRILLLDAALRHGCQTPARYEFRAVAPVLVDTPLTIGGNADGTVFLTDADGGLLATGKLTL